MALDRAADRWTNKKAGRETEKKYKCMWYLVENEIHTSAD